MIERIANNSDQFEPLELVRLAHVAGVAGSSFVDSLLQAALCRADSDPHIYLAAYTHAMQSGQESPEAFTHFQKACELSGSDGPVMQKPLQELAKMSRAGANTKTTSISSLETATRRSLWPPAR